MKYSLTVLTLLLIASSSFAQLEIKPTIGLNFSTVSNVEGGDASANIGWQVGASFLYGTKWYGEAGVYYMQRATEISSDSETIDKKISGIRVPIQGGIHLFGNEDSFATLRLFGGVSGFFVTSVDSGEGEVLTKDNVNSPQWGLLAGAGLDIWILFLDLKYEWSLTDISTDVQNIDVGQYRGFFINAGVRF